MFGFDRDTIRTLNKTILQLEKDKMDLKIENQNCKNQINKMSIMSSNIGLGANSSYNGVTGEDLSRAIHQMRNEFNNVVASSSLNVGCFFKGILRFFAVDYATSETILELVNKGGEENLIMANNMLYGFIKDKVKREIIEEINGNSKNS